MRKAHEAAMDAIANNHRIQCEWNTRMQPIQEEFIEEVIEDAVANGKPLVKVQTDWPLTGRLHQTLMDLGYGVGERPVGDDKYEITIQWCRR